MQWTHQSYILRHQSTDTYDSLDIDVLEIDYEIFSFCNLYVSSGLVGPLSLSMKFKLSQKKKQKILKAHLAITT